MSRNKNKNRNNNFVDTNSGKPYISVCIPCHNDGDSVSLLLHKIFDSKFSNFEVIVVDDCSTDDTEEVLKSFPGVRYIKHEKNSGAGRSRNDAAKVAKGEVLLYFDADVLPKGDIVKEVAEYFKQHLEVDAVSGFPGTGWENSGHFGKYKFWRDYCYWHIERNPSSLVYFRPAVGGLKKEAYLRTSGFPEVYKGASIEDLEFSYNLAKVAKIAFDPKMIVLHPFGGFSKLLKTYFNRTYLYAGLLSRTHEFSGVATTPGEAASAIVTFLSLVALALTFISPYFIVIWGILFLIFLSMQRKFLGFVLYKEGVFFWIFSIVVSMILYMTILAGAGWFVLRGGWRSLPGILSGKHN